MDGWMDGWLRGCGSMVAAPFRLTEVHSFKKFFEFVYPKFKIGLEKYICYVASCLLKHFC